MLKLTAPRVHRFSKPEYHQMHDLGFFIDQHVELIDGEVIDMPRPGHRHCVAQDKVGDTLKALFAKIAWVRLQMPLDLKPNSEPLPDAAVVAGPREAYSDAPTTALLVVEVSDSTLAEDRMRKASLYAAAGIADYWIVNLVDNQLEVRRNPIADAAQPFGHRYADLIVLNPGDVASPLVLPATPIPVSQLLP